ncbi:uncharacterized protein LOC118125360 [Hippoglossus stenolepis]|uniref:uncharacterized protein LOC118125360 n=1 Tax=Hippoglossus stenolepis TaxID=195615 RepID=UPI00159C7A59|nr:uncharacterized protein LOC118125360 [Hippoglossus stenolepis]
MAHKLKVLPAEASCGEQEMGIGSDEPVCILIEHCRDMKQQETRLRLITLLLFLCCSALYIFTICAELRKREQQSSGEQRAAAPLQQSLHAAVNQSLVNVPSAEKKRFNIQLSCIFEKTKTEGKQLLWVPNFSSDNQDNNKTKAIVIPEDGVYFIYIGTSLSCRNDLGAASFNEFHLRLSRWSQSYIKHTTLAESQDGLMCPPVGFRSVYVGQLFDLSEGDHVSVWIEAGYELIEKSTFGAYRVES